MSFYLRYEKPKDADAILAQIENSIKVKQESLFIIGVILEVAKKWDGKTINKRFGNDINKVLEPAGYKAYYRPQFGMFHIDVDYKNTTECKFSSLICYNSDPTVNYERVAEHNRCYTLDAGRITALEDGKAKVADMVDRWNAALAVLKAINEEAGKYELEYTFEMDRDKK